MRVREAIDKAGPMRFLFQKIVFIKSRLRRRASSKYLELLGPVAPATTGPEDPMEGGREGDAPPPPPESRPD